MEKNISNRRVLQPFLSHSQPLRLFLFPHFLPDPTQLHAFKAPSNKWFVVWCNLIEIQWTSAGCRFPTLISYIFMESLVTKYPPKHVILATAQIRRENISRARSKLQKIKIKIKKIHT